MLQGSLPLTFGITPADLCFPNVVRRAAHAAKGATKKKTHGQDCE